MVFPVDEGARLRCCCWVIGPQGFTSGGSSIELPVKGMGSILEDFNQNFGGIASVAEVAVEGSGNRDEVFEFAALNPESLEVAKDQALEDTFWVS